MIVKFGKYTACRGWAGVPRLVRMVKPKRGCAHAVPYSRWLTWWCSCMVLFDGLGAGDMDWFVGG